METAMMRGLLGVYFSLGQEYRLPIFFPRLTPALLRDVGLADMTGALDQFLEDFNATGMLMVDHCELSSLGSDPDETSAHYRSVAASLKPGVTHLLIHPAVGDDELQAITPDSWRQRGAEDRLFGGSEVPRWVESEGVHRIGYREIRSLMRI